MNDFSFYSSSLLLPAPFFSLSHSFSLSRLFLCAAVVVTEVYSPLLLADMRSQCVRRAAPKGENTLYNILYTESKAFFFCSHHKDA